MAPYYVHHTAYLKISTLNRYHDAWNDEMLPIFEDFGWKRVIGLQFLFGRAYEIINVFEIPNLEAYKPAMEAVYTGDNIEKWGLGEIVKDMNTMIAEDL